MAMKRQFARAACLLVCALIMAMPAPVQAAEPQDWEVFSYLEKLRPRIKRQKLKPEQIAEAQRLAAALRTREGRTYANLQALWKLGQSGDEAVMTMSALALMSGFPDDAPFVDPSVPQAKRYFSGSLARMLAANWTVNKWALHGVDPADAELMAATPCHHPFEYNAGRLAPVEAGVGRNDCGYVLFNSSDDGIAFREKPKIFLRGTKQPVINYHTETRFSQIGMPYRRVRIATQLTWIGFLPVDGDEKWQAERYVEMKRNTGYEHGYWYGPLDLAWTRAYARKRGEEPAIMARVEAAERRRAEFRYYNQNKEQIDMAERRASDQRDAQTRAKIGESMAKRRELDIMEWNTQFENPLHLPSLEQLSARLGGEYLDRFAYRYPVRDVNLINQLCNAGHPTCAAHSAQHAQRLADERAAQLAKVRVPASGANGSALVTVRNYDANGNYVGSTTTTRTDAELSGAR